MASAFPASVPGFTGAVPLDEAAALDHCLRCPLDPVALVSVALLFAALSPVATVGSLDEARSVVARERERTREERRAFAAFARRVQSIDPGPTGGRRGPESPLAVQAADAGRPATGAVREAYRDTVMAVPHVETEYGESLEQHMQAELGDGAAVALLDADRFSPRVKQWVLHRSTAMAEQRSALLDALDREAGALAEYDDRLGGVRTDLASLDADAPPSRYPFSRLVCEWHRLDALADRCDAVLTDRQESLSTRAPPSLGASRRREVLAYVYRPLDVRCPVLDAALDVREQVASERARRAWVLARKD